MDRNAWITAIASLAFSAVVQAAPFAMITDLKGEAWRSDGGGKQSKLVLLGYIENPAEVKVEAATKLGITYFASGVQYSFDGPARIALEAEAPRVLEGKSAQPSKVGPEKAIAGGMSNDQWRRLQQATVVMRTVKSSFTVVGPDKTTLLAREPEFEWTPAADAKRYRLVIYGQDNQVLHETTTEHTALRPGSAVKLEAGRQYRWKVDALGVAKPVSAAGSFAVADDAARGRIEATRPAAGAPMAARVFFATSLEAEGFMTDARAEWKALAREYPDIPELKQRSN
jgi:hypothetical protein